VLYQVVAESLQAPLSHGLRLEIRRRLSGASQVTNRTEIVDIHTTMLNNRHLFHIVQVVPENEQRQYVNAFNQMLQSLRFGK
jgi:hypothetical protein